MPANGNAPFFVDFLDNAHYFRGREEILLRLHETLQANNAAAITGVTGMGGVGKTQLAVRYIYQYRAHYPDGIYLLTAAADLRKVFADFGQKLWMIAAYRNQKIDNRSVATLARLIRTLFDDEELITLCFDLNIPEGDLPDRPEARPLALVEYAKRHGRLSDLVRKMEAERPFLETLPHDELISLVFNYFQQNPDSLLVLDNLPNPTRLAEPVSQNHYLADLPCAVLFTTRSQNTGEFPALPLNRLPLPEAMNLLLADYSARRVVLNPEHPDHAEAQTICGLVGQLPLALRNAGAYLGEYEEVALAAYRQRLQTEGCLMTLDEDLAELQEDELVERQRAAVTATLKTQWEALRQENAKKLMQVAGLLPEAEYIPVDRLALLAGIPTMNKPGRPRAVLRYLKQLQRVSLIEELKEDQVRLHPLVREFASRQVSEPEIFCKSCAENLLETYEIFANLQQQYAIRGIDNVQEDLLTSLDWVTDQQLQVDEFLGIPPWCKIPVQSAEIFNSTPADNVVRRLQDLLKLLQREVHNLRDWKQSNPLDLFNQQMVYRAQDLDMKAMFQQVLAELEEDNTYLYTKWTARRASLAMEHTLLSHTDIVNSVAVTPDGDRAISTSADHTLKVWNLRTGKVEQTLRDYEYDNMLTVVMIPDGKRVISTSFGVIKVWDLDRGELEQTLSGHGATEVRTVVVTPDGKRAISVSYGTLIVWNLCTSEAERVIHGDADVVRAVAVTPNGERVILASEDATLKVWNLRTDKVERLLIGHETMVLGVAVTIDGERVISASYDCTLKVWNLDTGELQHTLKGHKAGVRAAVVTPDGKRVISASEDATLKVWNLNTGEVEQTLNGHEASVRAVAVTSDGKRAISASSDRTLRLWNLHASEMDITMISHEASVQAVAVIPNGEQVISASFDHTLKVWNLRTGNLEKTLIGHESKVQAVVVTPNGEYAISASNDWTLKVWNLRTGQVERTLSGHKDWVRAVAMMPGGERVISVSDDRTIKVWNLITGECEHTHVSGTFDRALTVATLSDEVLSISLTIPWTFEVSYFGISKAKQTLNGHKGMVLAVEVMPDETRVISASEDCTLKVWNLRTGECEQTLIGHEASVRAVAVTTDGKRAISASDDRTLKVWDISTGEELASLILDGSLQCVTIVNVGKQSERDYTIITGDGAGNVYCMRYVES